LYNGLIIKVLLKLVVYFHTLLTYTGDAYSIYLCIDESQKDN